MINIFKRKTKYVELDELFKGKISVNSINRNLQAQAIKENYVEPKLPKEKFWITE